MIVYLFMLLASLYLVSAVYIFRISIKRVLNIELVDFLTFFLLVKIVLYYLMPAFFRVILNGYDLDYSYSREDVELLNVGFVYAVEVISYSIFLAILSFLLRKLPQKRDKRIFELGRYSDYGLPLCYFFCVGFIVTRVTSIFGTESSILTLYTPLFYSTGLICGPLLLADCLRDFRLGKFIIGFLCFTMSFLTVGSRGVIIYSLILVVYYILFVIRRKTLNRRLARYGVFFLCALFVTGGAFKTEFSVDGNNSVVISVATDAEKSQGRNIADEVIWRFGALTRYSSAFFNLYAKGEDASYFPIYHSMQGVLPRFLNPEKAIPNTVNPHDIYSQGMYLISDEVAGNGTSMVEFSTGAHFYWEFGWIGVFFLSIVSAIYLFCALKFNSKFGIAAIPLTIAVMKPWGYMDLKIWTAEAILQIYQIFVPFVTILFGLIFFSFLRRSIFSRLVWRM